MFIKGDKVRVKDSYYASLAGRVGKVSFVGEHDNFYIIFGYDGPYCIHKSNLEKLEIEEVTYYKTKDGHVYDTVKKAQEHSDELNRQQKKNDKITSLAKITPDKGYFNCVDVYDKYNEIKKIMENNS